MKIILSVLTLLVIGSALHGQPANIRGQILDSTRNLIIGASINAQGSGSFAINSENGFEIKINKFPDTLLITAIGYKERNFVV